MQNITKTICEAENLIDIAPLGKATQSSLSKWSKKNDAQRAVMNIGNVDFAFHTEKEQNPWWELILDKPRIIEYIILHNRKDECRDRSRRLIVEVFDGKKYVKIYQGDSPFGAEPSDLPLILSYIYPHKIERIKITSQISEYFHLSKVNVLTYIPKASYYKKVLCTFADSGLSPTLKRFEEQAKGMPYNNLFIYTENELDKEFYDYWKDKFKLRGFGYWVWKPQIILQTLDKIQDGDILQYTDVGCHFNPCGLYKLDKYFDSTDKSLNGILGFQQNYLEKDWTKGDLFDYFNVRKQKDIYDTGQLCSGIIFIKKSEKSISIIKNWLKVYYDNFSLVDDSPSRSSNFNGFKENRHDQSIFSILAKINNAIMAQFYVKKDDEPIWALRDKIRII
jgi:hypothetical protein